MLSFRRKMVKRSPPEEIFVKRSPPEPEKIARYLVLSTQKKAKNRGSKKFYPLKTRFLDDSRGVSGKFFLNPKFLEKLIYIAFLGHFFTKICQIFLKRRLRARKWTSQPPEEFLGKPTPPPEISDGN